VDADRRVPNLIKPEIEESAEEEKSRIEMIRLSLVGSA
jgi:hypothetical protein